MEATSSETSPTAPSESSQETAAPTASRQDEENITGFLRFLEQNDLSVEDAERLYLRPPVDIETFINSPQYMNKPGTVFPAVMDELVRINSGSYVEVVFTGGIGSGKTTGALYTNAYQLYLLSCMRNPHEQFGLDPASEILLIFQNKTAELAKTVSYARFKPMIETSPYFQQHFMFDTKIKSKLVFPNRIEVVPVSGQESAAIGQNVMGGLIDELNYMEVIKESRRSVDAGVFDQAIAIYNSIARRRKSRFMQQGKLPGVLCLVSSRRYPGQFTDKKEAEARTDRTIYVYDKRTWDIRPDAYSGRTFNVFIGDLSRRPRILEPGAEADMDPQFVRAIPEEHRSEFENDIINALREVAGVSTLASRPFFINQEKVYAAFNRCDSILSEVEVDFSNVTLRILPKRFRDLSQPRWVHIDLGLTNDSAGVACGYVPQFMKVARDRAVETLPKIHIDFTLRVRPPRNDEINFEKIRLLLYKLRDLGMEIRWVSFDSFQSRDSIQILRQKGFMTGLSSVDKDTAAYDTLKTCIYDGRLEAPQHDWCVRELLSLERVPLKDKVDHPEGGCFTGDTRVALADGTLPTFRELVECYADKPFSVYAIGPEGLTIAEARNPRITKTATELVEVMLDNYQIIRCTPDHRFMLLDGSFVEAKDLSPDLSLMPLYRSRAETGGHKGYERVWCPVRRQRILAHHLPFYPLPEGRVVHHLDGQKHNNALPNLVVMGRDEHHALHAAELWVQRQAKMRAGHSLYYETHPEAREAQRKRMLAVHERRRGRNRTGMQQNHRILSVRGVEAKEAVYDLSVPGLENFALASGVFVHNSKDCADALAGCVYGLTMRRSIWLDHGVSLYDIPLAIREVSVKTGAAMKASSEEGYEDVDVGVG